MEYAHNITLFIYVKELIYTHENLEILFKNGDSLMYWLFIKHFNRYERYIIPNTNSLRFDLKIVDIIFEYQNLNEHFDAVMRYWGNKTRFVYYILDEIYKLLCCGTVQIILNYDFVDDFILNMFYYEEFMEPTDKEIEQYPKLKGCYGFFAQRKNPIFPEMYTDLKEKRDYVQIIKYLPHWAIIFYNDPDLAKEREYQYKAYDAYIMELKCRELIKN